jgi:starvation-inducible DNA-binding protein
VPPFLLIVFFYGRHSHNRLAYIAQSDQNEFTESINRQARQRRKTMSIDIGMSKKEREKIAEGLSLLLADSFTLYLKTHNFHWNVTGPMFNTLHVMFMDQYTELWNALDLIAERIRALGVKAPGTYREFSQLTGIKESEGSPNATEMLKQLLAGQEAVAKTARSIFPLVDKAGDEPTADLLTQRMQIHEKNAWMLRSMLDS